MSDGNLRIATWNVNSLNVRLGHVQHWLAGSAPDAPDTAGEPPVDVLAIQETKLTDERFPHAELAEAGWNAVWHGQKTYNGVAILARGELADPVIGIPGFEDDQARVIAATIDNVRVICVYVPNGQSVGSEKYDYKLRWLAALRDYIVDTLATHPNLVVCGDFNVAPTPADTHDPDKWEGNILCSEPERAALAALCEAGLSDAFDAFDAPEQRFTWWDYRQGGFRRNLGLRIDHHLISAPLAARLTALRIDVTPRRWERPSDHTPVICALST